jgi:predicted MPP superfamily phosphohydrolase
MKNTYEPMFGPLRWLLHLERLPNWATLGFLLGLTLVVYAAWQAPAAALFQFMVTLGDWLSLWLLPRTGRSFGPPKPPLIALAVVRAALMVVLGLVWPNLAVAVATGLLIAALSLYALWVEPFRLGVTRQTLETPKLDPDARPVRLLHLGDLHVERTGPRERELNRLVKELAPDLILFSGDYISLLHPDLDQAREDIRQVIAQWEAPLGVYVISGSPLVETEEMVASYVEGLDNLRWLRDEAALVETEAGPITILGMSTTHDRDVDVPRLRELTETLPNSVFRLLLYHSPDLAPEANELGYDLYLAGHTHGGQVRLPFLGPLITSSEFWRTYAMGRYELGQTTLYVTRGLGTEGASAPRIRLLCPPEIILWELRGARA